jgi:hypothetical protein
LGSRAKRGRILQTRVALDEQLVDDHSGGVRK